MKGHTNGHTNGDTVWTTRQHTLARRAEWRADYRRRRNDVLVVHPADTDTGIRFVCPGANSFTNTIPARWEAVVETRGGVVLGNAHGLTMRGAIPLLAALRVAGIDNALVEVQGSSIPTDDGDFLFYLEMIERVGLRVQDDARRLLYLADTIAVNDHLGFASWSPAKDFFVSVKTTANRNGHDDAVEWQTVRSDCSEPYAGAGADFDHSDDVAISTPGPGNASRPLWDIAALPEPRRAQLVDVIGHMALVGVFVSGHIRAARAGPQLYQDLLHAALGQTSVLITTVDAHRARYETSSKRGLESR